MLTARRGNGAIVSALVATKAGVDVAKTNSATALMCAAVGGHADALLVLMSTGAAVAAATAMGSTASMAAARTGHAATVSSLLQASTDIDAPDARGHSARCRAAAGGHFGAVVAPRQAGAQVRVGVAAATLAATAAAEHSAVAQASVAPDDDAVLAAALSALLLGPDSEVLPRSRKACVPSKNALEKTADGSDKRRDKSHPLGSGAAPLPASGSVAACLAAAATPCRPQRAGGRRPARAPGARPPSTGEQSAALTRGAPPPTRWAANPRPPVRAATPPPQTRPPAAAAHPSQTAAPGGRRPPPATWPGRRHPSRPRVRVRGGRHCGDHPRRLIPKDDDHVGERRRRRLDRPRHCGGPCAGRAGGAIGTRVDARWMSLFQRRSISAAIDCSDRVSMSDRLSWSFDFLSASVQSARFGCSKPPPLESDCRCCGAIHGSRTALSPRYHWLKSIEMTGSATIMDSSRRRWWRLRLHSSTRAANATSHVRRECPPQARWRQTR